MLDNSEQKLNPPMHDCFSLGEEKQLRELVERCRAGDQPAWKALFEKYVNEIKRGIIFILIDCSRTDLLSTDDALHDIFEATFCKAKKGIQGLKKPSSIKSWLVTIALNSTRDYLNALNTRDQKYEFHFKERTGSLSKPVSKDNNTELEQILPAPEPDETFAHAADDILAQIAQLPERDQWVFRLRIIFHDPFGPAQVENLAAFLQKPIQELRGQLNELMDKLVQQEAQKNDSLTKADRLRFEMERDEHRLNEFRAGSGVDADDIQALEEAIQAKAKRIRDLENAGQQLTEPSDADVARIMGIDPLKASYVSVIVHRVRERLKKCGPIHPKVLSSRNQSRDRGMR
jgi:RNA polymerase sigma factor (sigma-70 family)